MFQIKYTFMILALRKLSSESSKKVDIFKCSFAARTVVSLKNCKYIRYCERFSILSWNGKRSKSLVKIKTGCFEEISLKTRREVFSISSDMVAKTKLWRNRFRKSLEKNSIFKCYRSLMPETVETWLTDSSDILFSEWSF